MMEYAIGAAAGLVLGLLIALVIAQAKAGGLPQAGQGLAVAKRANADKAFADKLQAILAGADIKPIEPPKPLKPSGAALRMLAILQGEARLVDFLLEDIQQATDQQIGQAVREVHKKAQAALKQHAVIDTVLPGNEGDTATVPRGFDSSAIRVVGNVTGEPPFTGQIQHPGWRVKELKVAPLPDSADEFVLQPAEVNIN
ncbi:MAG TPA: DUF2760 domain-containing protein [Urbifossiella sp.]|nr:DUF2760 domain-containing protein [Urbifossiella sp.]